MFPTLSWALSPSQSEAVSGHNDPQEEERNPRLHQHDEAVDDLFDKSLEEISADDFYTMIAEVGSSLSRTDDMVPSDDLGCRDEPYEDDNGVLNTWGRFGEADITAFNDIISENSSVSTAESDHDDEIVRPEPCKGEPDSGLFSETPRRSIAIVSKRDAVRRAAMRAAQHPEGGTKLSRPCVGNAHRTFSRSSFAAIHAHRPCLICPSTTHIALSFRPAPCRLHVRRVPKVKGQVRVHFSMHPLCQVWLRLQGASISKARQAFKGGYRGARRLTSEEVDAFRGVAEHIKDKEHRVQLDRQGITFSYETIVSRKK
jgi:hypothetical protein